MINQKSETNHELVLPLLFNETMVVAEQGLIVKKIVLISMNFKRK